MFRRLVVVAALLGLAGGAAVAVASSSGAENPPAFEATFDNASDFAAEFDNGWSGQNPLAYGDGIRSWQASHGVDGNGDCLGPDTQRTVNLLGTATNLDFSQLFYWCGPPNVANGHVMTTVTTKGYNVAWFSPKPTFTSITKVCWDVNETDVGARKWVSVLFVGETDASQYPAGTVLHPIAPDQVARGSGGFDLGYTDPEFRGGLNDGIYPSSPDTLAGFRDIDRSASWFQNGHWTSLFAGAKTDTFGLADQATRYKHCLENVGAGTVRNTVDTPSGVVVRDMVGHIPQDARRVVFADDNYNPQKDERLTPDHLAWHWDNIQVFAGDVTSPPDTTVVPTTTTAAPTTTTAAPTTTVASACPSDFTVDQLAWCETVESRLTALGG